MSAIEDCENHMPSDGDDMKSARDDDEYHVRADVDGTSKV